MNNENLLMIFIKNPVKGKVKTRLAKTVGEERALEIYLSLLQFTHTFSLNVDGRRQVLYSDKIEYDDLWEDLYFEKCVQQGADLGERMYNAFEQGFSKGFNKIVIIGSDCFELTSELVNEAFQKLTNNDFVLGPATDGGYYLLGMKRCFKTIFENKSWSTSSVFRDTLDDIKRNNLSCFILPTLSDIDEEKDLPKSFLNKY